MYKIDNVDLTKHDLSIIIKNVDKEKILEPLKLEKYKDYTNGFRNVNLLPEGKVTVFYYQEIFKKSNISLREKLSKIIQPTIEKFIKEINNIFPNFNPNNENELRAQEFKKLSATLTEKYSTEIIPVLFKLIGFKLNNTQNIILEMQADKKIAVINMQAMTEKRLEKEFNNRLQIEKERITGKLESKTRLEYQRLKEDYNLEIKKLESQYENKIIRLEVELKEAKDTNNNLKIKQIRYSAKQEKILEKADSKVSELNRLIYTLNNDIKNLKGDVFNRKNEEEILKNKVKNLEGLLDLRRMEKVELIALVNEAVSQDNVIKDRFKSFFRDFNEKEINEKINLIDEWNKWTSIEITAVNNLLSRCISKGDLTRADLELLDEVTYTLQLRFLISKLFIHLGYKYLASEYWQELFQ